MEKVKKNILGHLQVLWKEVNVNLHNTELNIGISWLTEFDVTLYIFQSANKMPVFSSVLRKMVVSDETSLISSEVKYMELM